MKFLPINHERFGEARGAVVRSTQLTVSKGTKLHSKYMAGHNGERVAWRDAGPWLRDRALPRMNRVPSPIQQKQRRKIKMGKRKRENRMVGLSAVKAGRVASSGPSGHTAREPPRQPSGPAEQKHGWSQ